ncbi:hypothetical protein [Sphingomonas sp.]|uniref:hypothetical protein n=1 Tax=Sphingomonas sp. TaxID=28214 RepID=UPI003B006F4A
MPFISTFDFKFPANAHDQAVQITRSIGHDMTELDGYEHHEVIQDVTDPGHLMVNTRWAGLEKAQSVLDSYQHDQKIKQAEALIPGGPQGFIGALLS